MNLSDLKQPIPYQWKIQSSFTNKVACVAYIDARDVQNLLDKAVGPQNWKDTYFEIGGRLFCSLSIKMGDEWVSKCDTGEESQSSKDKGIVSDCFKRAAVKWGVGRFLYDLDIVYLPAQFTPIPGTNKKKTEVLHDLIKYPGVPSNLLQGNMVNQYKLTEYINFIRNKKG